MLLINMVFVIEIPQNYSKVDDFLYMYGDGLGKTY